jgi:hypothetical protein
MGRHGMATTRCEFFWGGATHTHAHSPSRLSPCFLFCFFTLTDYAFPPLCPHNNNNNNYYHYYYYYYKNAQGLQL